MNATPKMDSNKIPIMLIVFRVKLFSLNNPHGQYNTGANDEYNER